jgi:hypothetical protein
VPETLHANPAPKRGNCIAGDLVVFGQKCAHPGYDRASVIRPERP